MDGETETDVERDRQIGKRLRAKKEGNREGWIRCVCVVTGSSSSSISG